MSVGPFKGNLRQDLVTCLKGLNRFDERFSTYEIPKEYFLHQKLYELISIFTGTDASKLAINYLGRLKLFEYLEQFDLFARYSLPGPG